MLKFLRAFLFDGVAWLLLLVLIVLFIGGVTHLFNRHDELDIYVRNLSEINRDIQWLKVQKSDKEEWLSRLESDSTSWEIVAREKMNYLGREQVLLKFHDSKSQSQE